jgi:ABC-type phosphate transport system substrate-binding protein
MYRRTFIIAAMVLLLGGHALADDLAIVMGADSATDNVTSAELVKIFRGEKGHTADGKKIVVVMRQPGSPERAAALDGIYGMSEQEFKTYFLQATFTGAVASAPKTQNSVDGLKAYLAKTPGAIGYVFAKDVDASVKVVKIDGKGPGDDGYKLKGK